ncbi:DUF5050 domain-containing protein [Sporomusa sp.]|uniref:DUF5050 domain-containing protein n=1 Tax=Sporomusa sp. TaxID=2078658 RepID=UPI002C9CDC56|nr:DUF5050 domain-containing protein [Sporomusa sp.]HWR05553.1 DUF5050 domain-containing protein [Sporomusa sp.]
MPVRMSFLVILITLLLLFSPSQAAAGTSVTLPATDTPAVVELKLFHLEYKDVVAIAVETRLPATGVADPLTYMLEPVYQVTRQDGLLEITLAAQSSLPELTGQATFTKTIASPRLQQVTIAATATNQLKIAAAYNNQIASVQVTTVKRKQIIQLDNTITFRTYLVLHFTNTGAGLSPKTIVLDPGHGGPDLGATRNFLFEKELNLDIARLSRDLFTQHGYDVYMTRNDDSRPSLLDRADAANILDAAALISIHNNSIPADMPETASKLYRGTTALYNSAAPQPAKELATLIADQVAHTLRIPQYPLQDRPGLVVLNSTWVPAVIAEIAMMPHPQDAKMISQRVYRLEAAQALVQATDTYFKTKDPSLPAATPATISPGSRAVSRVNNTLYYLDLAGDTYAGSSEKIYRLNAGKTTPTVLSDDEAWNLNISGKYLYYSNWSDNHSIYRLSLDGTEKTKITTDPANQVTLAGNWLVYVKWTNRYSAQDNNIFKTSLDGSATQKINCDQSENLSIIGDWVYYLNASDDYKIYKVKLDGTGRSKIGNDRVLFMAAAGSIIYYSNYDDGQRLYAIGTDGHNRMKLTNDKAGFIAVANGDIYYTNTSANDALYRIKAKTKIPQLICDLGAGPLPITIVNNTLYYHHLFFRL